MATCTLCDLPTPADPVTGPDVEGEFCCRGCLEVSRSLGGMAGLEAAAEDVDAALGTQAGSATADPASTETAVDAPASTEAVATDTAAAVDDLETTYLHVDGMHCATCERFLEVTAARADGVEAATASYATDTVRVDHDPDRIDDAGLTDVLSTAGYEATDRRDRSSTEDDAVDVVRFLVGGGLFGMMAMLWYVLFLYPTYFGYAPLVDLGGLSGRYLFAQIWVFTSVVLLYTGFPILRGAYVSLRARQPNMDLLVSLAAVSSYVYSTLAMLLGRTDLYFDVTIAVILVVTGGGIYETRIKRRATGLLSELTAAMDDTARLADGEEVPLADVDPGDRLRVLPGERVPLDGTVIEGTAAVDEALVTGESIPDTKRPEDAVRGGTVVTDAPLVVRVGADATSTLDRLVELLWDVQSARSGAQRLADRLATVFVPLVVTVAVVVGLLRLASGATLSTAALVALTVLIVSCPCAFGLATPLAVAAGIREAAERGIVIASAAVFERAGSIDTIVFDKTGTLTDGEMRVLDIEPVIDTHPAGGSIDDPSDAGQILARAAVLERASPHPVATAIVDRAETTTDRVADGGRLEDATGMDDSTDADPPSTAADPSPAGSSLAASVAADTSVDGGVDPDLDVDVAVRDRGVVGTIDGVDHRVGHPSLFDDWTIPEAVDARVSTVRSRGNVPVLVGWDGAVRGVIAVGDDVRDGWESVVSNLADRGMEIVVLTGDSPEAASRFESHPSIDRVFAGVPPEAKAETVSRLAATRSVAMVGDGSNDAPALAAATLGIAVSGGTDLAVDAADAVVLEDRLAAIPELFALIAGTTGRIRANLGWALLYNAVAIPLAVAGVLNPLLAALAMGSSSLLVVLNSSRAILDDR
ncbi:Cu2+-exporting ATPase [Halopenitus malekzadehii]|uniref:Cu2+-exporting ATPase n=1 Tax=Halopenitus malekzadehii TaxID=1267564 RepID=A0A1H6HSD1_9EURY|nr:cation-translocating P-type ATPase [Halopenitus malekzadehii]SEH37064.1 Cu2+-exporting ATPase [Halopenitus malekzadehii]